MITLNDLIITEIQDAEFTGCSLTANGVEPDFIVKEERKIVLFEDLRQSAIDDIKTLPLSKFWTKNSYILKDYIKKKFNIEDSDLE